MRTFFLSLLILILFPFVAYATPSGRYQRNKAWNESLQLMLRKQDYKIFKEFMSQYSRKPGINLEEYRRTVYMLLSSHAEFFSAAATKVYAGNHDCYLRWVAVGDEKSDQTIRPSEKMRLLKRLEPKVQSRFEIISKSNGGELRVKNCD